MIKENS